jgi:hypothetical protein
VAEPDRASTVFFSWEGVFRSVALKKRDRHPWRLAIFLVVLVSHVVTVLLVVRAARFSSAHKLPNEPLVLMHLQAQVSADQGVSRPSAPSARSHLKKREPAPDNAITTAPEVPVRPPIDWAHEAELAAESGIADSQKEANYRNLAGMSAAQLSWIKHNHMEPAPPGIAWHHPRFEFDQRTGIPVYWINDHCVLVMLFVFCAVGHIEADGELFKHMHDPHDP